MRDARAFDPGTETIYVPFPRTRILLSLQKISSVLRWKDMGYEYAKEFLPDYRHHDRGSDYFKKAKEDFYHTGILSALEKFVYFVEDPKVLDDMDNITTFAFNKYVHAFPSLMKYVRENDNLSMCSATFCGVCPQ